MINLKEYIARDIEEGIAIAQTKGLLPKVKGDRAVVVTRNEKPERGDYASPVGLSLGKRLKKNPMDVVSTIVTTMPKKEYIGKIEVAAPGFLNIWINPGWMIARLNNLVVEDICPESTEGRGKSVNLEFISANPNGPLTLANARTAFSADSLGNVFSCAAYNVVREYYINDAGNQVKRLGESIVRRAIQAQGKTIDFPETLYQGEYIKDVAKVIAENWQENEGRSFTEEDLNNPTVMARVSEEAVTIFLGRIKQTIQEDLKIEFNVWTSEKKLRDTGKVHAVLERLQKQGDIYEKDKAQYVKTTKYGDSEDRVVVKKDGDFAYFAPDIAYHDNKYAREFDLIFTFLGADHQGHTPRILAAMKALGHDTNKLHFVIAQWFRLIKEGKPLKVSKRAGNVITPKDLIDEVGYDPARFFLLQHRLSSHMDFDMDLAKERNERNPVYYVQYAYVRLQSIIRRAQESGMVLDSSALLTTTHPGLTHTFEVELMRQLYRFPEVITDITRTFAIHDVTYYALDLAKAIHVFYKQVPVLSSDETLLPSRLQLVMAAKAVIGKTLDLLGISKPDIM